MKRKKMECPRCFYQNTYEDSYCSYDEPPLCPCCHSSMKEVIELQPKDSLSQEQKRIKENIIASIRYHGAEMVFSEIDLFRDALSRCIHRKLFLLAIKELKLPWRLEEQKGGGFCG